MDEDKPLIWIGTSKEDLSAFPDDVKLVMGFALRMAQKRQKHARAKPLKGYGGAGVLEIVDDYDTDSYRAVYTVSFAGVLYALHAFQKKSKTGKKTTKADLDMVKRRMKAARSDYEQRGPNEEVR